VLVLVVVVVVSVVVLVVVVVVVVSVVVLVVVSVVVVCEREEIGGIFIFIFFLIATFDIKSRIIYISRLFPKKPRNCRKHFVFKEVKLHFKCYMNNFENKHNSSMSMNTYNLTSVMKE
jgi:hypothetical protein